MIYELASIAKPKEVKNILSFCIQKDFLKAKNELLKTMLENGLSGLDMIKQIQKEIWGLDIDDKKKLSMTKECGEVEFRMVEGSDEFIQLESLISKFVLINN